MTTLSTSLRLKHRVATSPFSGVAGRLRDVVRRARGVRHPELGLLRCEDAMIDAVMKRRIGRDWNCLDVGAHLGSVFYRLCELAPQGHHAMVEASADKAAMLRARFGADRVHEVAVSDTPGEVSFFENLDDSGFSSLANRSSRGRVVERKVTAARLDDLMGDARVDFIKIDVEGFEFPALRGAKKLLERCRPVIQFEAGAVADDDLQTATTDALFDWLTNQMNYDVYAAFDLFYDRPAIDAAMFASYRRYPFLAFNYFALPRGNDTP
ncbi:Methyltransferase FkbM family [Sulfitobacter noctilucicola]|uniref:FkbM family methyltransferase n=1 Tax=Sulfitobacter noctilucicola TaxID=1342301 RepID=A0A7W6M9A4_9RHOB|nr:FkbM family methyltransferase [Sulfitobacter noctilucicola]KIN63667.1 Methyltransferase FkbM family [Sulfitobacter noctilucicola]MBB4174823.1 FkbM family methyltransferase [Sulfitobacter noctilucicola]